MSREVMDSFFSYLKHAREASGLPLEEISDQTLINMKMLEALEQGEVQSLPQAYVRAFIREYAAAIGLDPAETLQRYDQWLEQSATGAEKEPSIGAAPQPEEVRQASPARASLLDQMPIIWKISIAIVVLVLLDVVLWSVLEKEPMREVKELPFREVIREMQERTDTTLMVPVGAASRTAPDSLTLVATTTDSVWMQIALDDTIMTEHFLYPKTSRQWKAKNSFLLVVIGNPAAVTFTLNNKPVSIPVRRGFVTRNVRFDRSSLQ